MAQPRGRNSPSDSSHSGEETHNSPINTTSDASEHALQQSIHASGAAHDSQAAAPKKRKRVARACMSCQKSHMSCGDERPCSRCVDRGIAHSCCDGERKPRPAPSSGAHSSSVSANKRSKIDENKQRANNKPFPILNSNQIEANFARGAAVLPFAPVPSAGPVATTTNPYAYYWQGAAQVAPPSTLDYHLTQEMHQHQHLAPPHPHQQQVTADHLQQYHHHHQQHMPPDSLYARPMQYNSNNTTGYFASPKVSTPTTASSYLTPTDSSSTTGTAASTTANTPASPGDSSSAAASTTALESGSSLLIPPVSQPLGANPDHYDYYYASTNPYAAAAASSRYWDSVNSNSGLQPLDYSNPNQQSLYSMDFTYHQQAQMQHRGAMPPAQAQPVHYAVPPRPSYVIDNRGPNPPGSLHSQMI